MFFSRKDRKGDTRKEGDHELSEYSLCALCVSSLCVLCVNPLCALCVSSLCVLRVPPSASLCVSSLCVLCVNPLRVPSREKFINAFQYLATLIKQITHAYYLRLACPT